jgi:hypothetical protein
MATQVEISRRLAKIRHLRICRAAHVVAEKFRDLFTNYAHGVRACAIFVAENCQNNKNCLNSNSLAYGWYFLMR